MKHLIFVIFSCVLFLFPTQGNCGKKCETALLELQKEAEVNLRKEDFKGEKPCQRVKKITFGRFKDLSLKRFSQLLSKLSLLKKTEKIDLYFQDIAGNYLSGLNRHHEILNSFRSIEIQMSIKSPLSNDKEMKSLMRITNLTFFAAGSLKKMKITSASIDILSKSTRLKGLGLVNTNLTDKDFVSLKSLTQIETMNLSGCKINGKMFSMIKKNPIRKLLLSDTNINDEGLIHFKNLSELESLSLTDCPIKGSGLKHLVALKKLSRIALTGTLMNGKSLIYLKKMPALQELFLNRCDISDADIPVLKKFVGLKRLTLEETKVTSKGLRELKKELPKTIIDY